MLSYFTHGPTLAYRTFGHGPLPVLAFHGFGRTGADFADVFAMIDALGHFHGHGFHFDEPANDYYVAADPTLWFADCVHPNDVGHAQMSGLFHEAIDPSFTLP